MDKIRKQILLTLETNSRIDLNELAVLLGTDEVTIANEVAAMEKEHIGRVRCFHEAFIIFHVSRMRFCHRFVIHGLRKLLRLTPGSHSSRAC